MRVVEERLKKRTCCGGMEFVQKDSAERRAQADDLFNLWAPIKASTAPPCRPRCKVEGTEELSDIKAKAEIVYSTLKKNALRAHMKFEDM